MKTILIVEDEPASYKYLGVILRPNYKLLYAEDGEKAVQMAKDVRPDLILMDIRMPKMNGIEAIDTIRQFLPNVPVVVQSAYAFDSDIETALNHGANGYITKPYLREQVESVINKFL